jgi:hypothetical protein
VPLKVDEAARVLDTAHSTAAAAAADAAAAMHTSPTPPLPPQAEGAAPAGDGADACSLNGRLSDEATSGRGSVCTCDPGWRGAKCQALDVAPSRVLWPQLSDGDPRNTDCSSLSWGGCRRAGDGAITLRHLRSILES